MKENKCGRIINIASRSDKVARKQLGGYAASKFGVIGLKEAIYI
jgi:short-subunit dehydrogenase